jgi:hypothetical protein
LKDGQHRRNQPRRDKASRRNEPSQKWTCVHRQTRRDGSRSDGTRLIAIRTVREP